MNKFVSTAKIEGTTSVTENGDKTYTSSLDANVDLFFQIGAIRGQAPDKIKALFSAAYAEDKDLASRILLWARDIRGGAGERRTFKIILEYLIQHDLPTALRVANRIPELGRWDDLFVMFEDQRAREGMFALIKLGLSVPETAGLVAKWLPRDVGSFRVKKYKGQGDKPIGELITKKAVPADRLRKNEIARELQRYLGLTPRLYRKMLSRLSKTVENDMCAKKWGEIKYEHVPSVASARYGKAFGRHDQARYAQYLESVKKGEKKINTGAVYPYDVLKAGVDDVTADTMWNKLPDYVQDGLSFLPMIDVSGSMTSPAGADRRSVSCLDVAVSLGIYLAERNKSDFERMALTFNGDPRLFQIPKGTIRQKQYAVKNSDRQMAMNTNLDRAFDLILSVARNGNVPQEDMPTHLIVLSDMEFDGRRSSSVAERTKEKFRQAGYNLPNIIWWNIQSRNGNIPVRAGESGMALVSGFSPTIMTSIMKDGMNPRSQMLETIMNARYNLD